MLPRLSRPSLLQRPSLPQRYLDGRIFTSPLTIDAVLTANFAQSAFFSRDSLALLAGISPRGTLLATAHPAASAL